MKEHKDCEKDIRIVLEGKTKIGCSECLKEDLKKSREFKYESEVVKTIPAPCEQCGTNNYKHNLINRRNKKGVRCLDTEFICNKCKKTYHILGGWVAFEQDDNGLKARPTVKDLTTNQ